MPTQTPNLKLDTYNTTTDSGTKFQTFRASIAGDQTSNTTKIDKWAGEVNTKLTALEDNKSAILVNASWVSVGYYESACESISSFKEGMLITIKLNKDSDGTTTIKINNLETKSLLKYSKSGNTTNIVAGDLKINKEYSFRYDGTSFIWQNANSGDQINVSGTQGNVMSISLNNTIEDSGVSIGSGQISTVDKTIVGSINELKTGIDDNASEISILSTNKADKNNGFNGVLMDTIAKPSDMNSMKTQLNYETVWDTTGILNFPNVTRGTTRLRFKVEKLVNDMVRQEIEFQVGAVSCGIWYRSYIDGGWQEWRQLATTDKIDILFPVNASLFTLTQYSDTKIYKDCFGQITMNIIIKMNTTIQGTTAIVRLGTIPVGFRPSNSIRYPISTTQSTNVNVGFFEIGRQGDFYIYPNGKNVDEISINIKYD